ncbi:apoptosis facilitator Bcl-2-like protein 14 isoform X1 [Lepisosteus oculatus]
MDATVPSQLFNSVDSTIKGDTKKLKRHLETSLSGAWGTRMQHTMTRATMNGHSVNPQVLSLGQKDAQRVLEVYVRRSLSLNEGTLDKHKNRVRRWETTMGGNGRVRRASSDTSVDLGPPDKQDPKMASEPAQSESPAAPQGSSTELIKKHKKAAKKGKKTSFLKSVISLFSRKGNEEKEEKEANSEERLDASMPPESPSFPVTCLPISRSRSGQTSASQRSRRKSTLKKTFSFRSRVADEGIPKTPKKPSFLALRTTVHKPEAVSYAGPRQLYYEKLSEEMVRIVKEVKDIPDEPITSTTKKSSKVADKDEELIKKIVSILQSEGDLIDEKLKENVTMSNFFQRMNYSSFRELADQYVETETPSRRPQGNPPLELVKFAFALDFTAKVAGICNHTVSCVMGFGNQYLQDRFTQYQNSGNVDTVIAENLASPD